MYVMHYSASDSMIVIPQVAQVAQSKCEILFQSLVETLNDLDTAFSRIVCRNVCKRIIQRRQQISKIRRYLRDFKSPSDFDDALARFSQCPVTLQERPAVVEELAKYVMEDSVRSGHFVPVQQQEVDSLKQCFERLVNARRRSDGENPKEGEHSTRCTASATEERADRMLTAFENGVTSGSLEESPLQTMISSLDNILPTSVPCERAFSRARKVRHYSRERLADEKFEQLMFVRSMLRHDAPIEVSQNISEEGDPTRPSTDEA